MRDLKQARKWGTGNGQWRLPGNRLARRVGLQSVRSGELRRDASSILRSPYLVSAAPPHRSTRDASSIPHSPFPIPGAPRAPRAQHGFTLIEILLATVLLAAGLALAFTTLRAATGTTQRGESIAERSERMRAVEGFLRRRISGARPIAFGSDPGTGMQLRFSGDAAHMRFVADLPDYLGRGGPTLHELLVEPDGDGVQLRVRLAMVQGGAAVEESPPRAPEPLVRGMREIRFRYRLLDDQNRPGEWQDAWERSEGMPLQVQVLMRDGQGRDWPPLVVALPLASSYAAMSGAVL